MFMKFLLFFAFRTPSLLKLLEKSAVLFLAGCLESNAFLLLFAHILSIGGGKEVYLKFSLGHSSVMVEAG